VVITLLHPVSGIDIYRSDKNITRVIETAPSAKAAIMSNNSEASQSGDATGTPSSQPKGNKGHRKDR
jgi:hypothetical protein